MKAYLDIVRHVLENGKEKKPVRKNQQTGKWEPVDGGISTLACPNVIFSHDMCDGFPLLTTKKMAWKTLRVELEGFIQGITDKNWYKERGCNIWNEWANPEKVQQRMDDLILGPNVDEWETRKKLQIIENDLGPVYGYQWRHFDEHYGELEFKDYVEGGCNALGEYQQIDNRNGVDKGTDQLQNIVDALLNNPMDRRMICSAWNPNQANLMALLPCHLLFDVTVIGNELNLCWVQRSCDLLLGVPFNIASYALLLELLAYTADLDPGNLTGVLVDCHLYENQIEAAKEQLTREPRDLPCIHFVNRSGNLQKKFSIFDWTHEDVDLINYDPHPKLEKVKIVV